MQLPPATRFASSTFFFFFLAVVFIYARVGSAQLAQCVLCEGGLVLECVAIVAKGCAN